MSWGFGVKSAYGLFTVLMSDDGYFFDEVRFLDGGSLPEISKCDLFHGEVMRCESSIVLYFHRLVSS